MILKKYLIDLNLIVDNEYADSYVSLINENIDNEKIIGTTQKHHIVPKYYYLFNNLKIDNSYRNIVNLTYKDHILAHYFLSNCSASEYFKFSNISALKYLLGRNKPLLNDSAFLEKLESLQDLYEYYSYARSNFIYLKDVNNGKVWVNDGVLNKRVSKEDLDLFIQKGFAIGVCYETTKGKIVINNGKDVRFIYPDDLDSFLNKGWSKGHLRKPLDDDVKLKISSLTKNRMTGSTPINNGEINKWIKKDELGEFLKDGWSSGLIIRNKSNNRKKYTISDEQRLKKSEKIKDTIWVNKDGSNKRVKKYQLESYLDDGFVLGRYVEDGSVFSSNKDHKWMTKDGENISVSISDIDKYLESGYVIGRDMSTISKVKRKKYITGSKHLNSGGKYLYKEGIKKHFKDYEVDQAFLDGWLTYEKYRENI